MICNLTDLGHAKEKHSAFQVRTGMMAGAMTFFHEIGWYECKSMNVNGSWGQARFVCSSVISIGCHIFQLTELSDGDPEKLEMTENHIAVNFSNATPEVAAKAILEWACRSCAGEEASIEAANSDGTKWFVYLPALFKFAIEIV